MAKWNLDPAHAKIEFKVKHMVVSTVSGEFKEFDAHIESSKDDFSDAKIDFVAKVHSIDTRVEARNNHLKSPDFFDADHFPELKFTSTSGIQDGELTGNLEIRGVSRPVTLDVEFGLISDPSTGKRRAGMDLSGKISRKDFGLNWNAMLETGGAIVGDKIQLLASAEFLEN